MDASIDIGGGFGLGSDAARVAAAILFIQSSTNAMDVFSALNSSPWTSESFGGDPEKAKSCRRYVHHSLAVTAFYSGTASILAKSIWPMLGWGIAAVYMWKLYDNALRKARESGSASWDDSGSKAPAPPAPAAASNGNGSYPWSP